MLALAGCSRGEGVPSRAPPSVDDARAATVAASGGTEAPDAATDGGTPECTAGSAPASHGPEASHRAAALRPRANACVALARRADPSIAGKVVFSTTIASDGNVAAVTVVCRSGLPDSVVACIRGHLQRATFEPPGAGGATSELPFSFVPPR